ncbi:MAG: hypothetical protein K5754_13545 [Butyrivibrio sp.]|jgi:hypothetical protein|nr:hypothetical protein [Butyrivibrio sp.]
MFKVNMRGGFSDRLGIKKQNDTVQIHDLDKRTRIQIFNKISELYSELYGEEYYEHEIVQHFFRYVESEVFCEVVDTRNHIYDEFFWDNLKSLIQEASFDDVLTVVEAIVTYWGNMFNEIYRCIPRNGYYGKGKYRGYEAFNGLFEQEYVGYRFINKMITPISDEHEVDSINEASGSAYKAVTEHLLKAQLLLSDRDKPDYENSIKESISAVEAICEIFTGLHGREATLGSMFKKLDDKGIAIHGGLKSAFNSLYGYTSDANGIRHAGNIGGPASTFEEAKFMLVSCSAFINYLKGVMSD